MRRLRNPGFWMPCLYLAFVGVLYCASLLLERSGPGAGVLNLTDAAEASLDLVKEIAKLCSAWATTLFAAGGAIVVQREKWNSAWNRVDDFIIILVLTCGVATYYGVYMSYVELLSMAAVKVIAPLNGQLEVALSVQYYAALTGTLLLGVALIRILVNPQRRQG